MNHTRPRAMWLVLAVGAAVVGACNDDDEPKATSPAVVSTTTSSMGAVTTAPPSTAPVTTELVTPSTVTAARGTSAPVTTEPVTNEPVTSGPATTGPAAVSTSTIAPAETMQLSAYLVRDEAVALVHRRVARTLATSAASLAELLSGPSAEEAGLGLHSAIPVGTVALGVSIEAGVATVDLSESFGSGGGSLSMMLRLAQVVYTMTQFETVQAVMFEVEGQPVGTFGSEGIVIDHPLTRADFEDVTPAIFVDDPAPFDPVGPRLRVHGTANVFEATFMVRLTDAAGHVLYEHFQMATSGTGTRGTFDFTIDVPAAVPGTGLLRLWEPSAKDGSDTNVIEVPVQM